MTDHQSTYAQYLPIVLQQEQPALLHQLLTAFETVLTGAPGGLEHTITRLSTYFDPAKTPAEFLPWLAQWVALTLRADWEEHTRRAFIAAIIPLYRRRGTLTGLRQMLGLYLAPPRQPDKPLVSRVQDVLIEDGFPQRPHYFQVRLTVRADAMVAETQRIAGAIIDREKPAHTYYGLRLALPAMRIVSPELRDKLGPGTKLLTIGVNTLLGSEPATTQPSEGAGQ